MSRASVVPRGRECAVVVALIGAFAAVGVPAAVADGSFNQWTATGSMSTARFEQFSTVLADGDVFAGGGQSVTGTALSSTEIYSPSSGTWFGGPSMSQARIAATAVTLQTGAVLIVGGDTASSDDSGVNTGIVYSPATNTFGDVSNTMSSVRGSLPIAVRLSNGEVLVAGGDDATGTPVATADVYSPETNSFTQVASMNSARNGATGTLLSNGDVLVAGGSATATTPLASAELYDPTTNEWTPVSNPMSSPREAGCGVGLPDGDVLLAGGVATGTPTQLTTATTDVYNPATNTFTPGPSMDAARALTSCAPLPGGRVLIAGGVIFPPSPAAPSVDATTDVYDAASNTFSLAGGLPAAEFAGAATALSNGQVLLAGGSADIQHGSTAAELFTPTMVPGPPLAVSVSSGTGSALVTFAPPASDGGLAIEHYTVRTSTGQIVSTADARSSVDVTGLRNGAAVTFTVTATNSFGTGAASSPTAPVVIGPPQLTLSKLKTKLKLKAFLGGIKFTVTPNKSAALQISLLGLTSKATISRAYNLTLASKTFGLSAAKRSVTLKPSKRLVGNPKHATVELLIVAVGPDGGRSTTMKTISISR
jgi:hypothetical protein